MRLMTMTDYVMGHAGIGEREAAERVLEETLKAFASGLTTSEAQRLARELPSPPSQWFMNVEHGEAFGPDELYDRVQGLLGVDLGVAMEQAQVVLAAMVRELTPETRQWFRRRMGDQWSRLLEEQMRPSAPPRQRVGCGSTEHEEPHTLAEGRVGSTTPLSESAPRRSQSGSVVDDNPHADRKLSSAHEVQAEPMSSSNPRSKHPLNEDDGGE